MAVCVYHPGRELIWLDTLRARLRRDASAASHLASKMMHDCPARSATAHRRGAHNFLPEILGPWFRIFHLIKRDVWTVTC
jgi:hypothetical protein